MAERRVLGVDRRHWAIAGYALAAWIGAAVILGGPGLLARGHHELFGPLGWTLLVTAAATLVVVWTLPFAVRIRNAEDEYMRAGSKFAWYWGGSLGVLLSLPAYVFVAQGGLQWLWPAAYRWGLAPMRALTLGYGLLAVFQLAGFFVALAWWRWRGAPGRAP